MLEVCGQWMVAVCATCGPDLPSCRAFAVMVDPFSTSFFGVFRVVMHQHFRNGDFYDLLQLFERQESPKMGSPKGSTITANTFVPFRPQEENLLSYAPLFVFHRFDSLAYVCPKP